METWKTDAEDILEDSYVTLAILFFICWYGSVPRLDLSHRITRMVTSNGQGLELRELQARFPLRRVWFALCAAGASTKSEPHQVWWQSHRLALGIGQC